MRTTVTLDDDLARRLRHEAHARGLSFKAAINEAIRRGLDRPRETAPYRLRSVSMGVPAIDLTKATAIAGQLEDDELLRRLRPAP